MLVTSNSSHLPLSEIVESAPDALILINPKGIIELVNAQTESLFGYTKEELLGNKIEMLIPEKYRSGHHHHIDHYAQKPSKRNMGNNRELSGLRKDGTEFLVEISLSPIKTDEGLFVLSAIRDITERKSTEQFLNALVANVPGMVYRASAAPGYPVVYLSPTYTEQITGFKPEEFLRYKGGNIRYHDRVHEDDRSIIEEAYQKLLAAPTNIEIEYRIYHKEGHLKWVQERTKSTFENGQLQWLEGLIFDITGTKEAQLHFEEQARQLYNLIETVPGIVYRCKCESDWPMIFVNQEIEHLTGFSPDHFTGDEAKPFVELIHPDDVEMVEQVIMDAVKKKGSYQLMYRLIHRDGHTIWVQEKGKGVYLSDGSIKYLDGVITDISKMKKTKDELVFAKEQAESANKSKSEFLSSMSHELRTPLNGVLGYAQLLQYDETLNKSHKESLVAIENCGQHLLTMINDVLDFSKIEAGKMDLNIKPINLSKLLETVGDVIRFRAKEKKLVFLKDFSMSLPQFVNLDETKVRQVLINLLGNSVKFTHEGHIALTVTDEKGRLVFKVTDTGVGMSKSQQEHIYNPFKQLEEGINAGGTGLGLAITSRLIHIMEGKIQLESEEGKGTTFTVTLPLQEVREDDKHFVTDDPQGSWKHPVLKPEDHLKVLITDDRDTNRDIMDKIVGKAGFETYIAEDGLDALEMMEKHPDMDLVLMDIRMPGMNGVEATQRIRQMDLPKQPIIIAVTASVFPDFKDQALANGFDDFVGKPFKANEIFSKIAHHLKIEYIDQESNADGVIGSDGGSDSLLVPSDFKEELEMAFSIKNLTAMNGLAAKMEAAGFETAGKHLAGMLAMLDFAGIQEWLKESA